MRRLLTPCRHVNPTVARRWARSRASGAGARKGPPEQEEVFQAATAPSLRPAGAPVVPGFVTANTPSISSLRADIESLRKEKVFEESVRREHLQGKTLSSSSQQGREQSRSDTARRVVLPVTPPTYNLAEGPVGDAVRASEWLLGRRIQRDVNDVLRRKVVQGKSTTDQDSMKLASFAGVLRAPAMASSNKQALTELSGRIEAALQRYAPSASLRDVSLAEPAYLAAVLDVVHAASDKELALWVRVGLIDPLWWAEDATAAEGSENSSENTGSTSAEDVQLARAALDEMPEDLDPLRAAIVAGGCSAFVGAATERLKFGDVPPPDVAPAILKAERGEFADISEKELRALEVFEKQSAAGAQGVGRSLSSSSPLLAELAKRDDNIKTSMDVLERSKRDALLDKEFQEAVEYVNALHEGRMAAVGKVRPNPRSLAAAVPYFFGSKSSRPPPSADMNLQAPALSPEERRSIQRSKRLKNLRRFQS